MARTIGDYDFVAKRWAAGQPACTPMKTIGGFGGTGTYRGRRMSADEHGVLLSYTTPIARLYQGVALFRHNQWGPTTERHMRAGEHACKRAGIQTFRVDDPFEDYEGNAKELFAVVISAVRSLRDRPAHLEHYDFQIRAPQRAWEEYRNY